MTPPKPIWLKPFVLIAVLIACFAGAACGSSDPQQNSPAGPTPLIPSNNYVIDVAEINGPYSFYPSPATVRSEPIIIWRNSDTVTHRVVFDDLSVDTGTLAPGTSSQPITVGPGHWPYHCAIHPSMVGSVTVTASASTSGVRSK